MTTPSEKRCYYQVLDLPQTCTQEEIRSSYKRLALQRHPDKLIQSGVSSTDATTLFQELRHAYEVLSDPKERSWYDSHRTQILYSSPFDSNTSDDFIPDLFSFFSTSCFSGFTDSDRGFFRVYGDLFGRIYLNELNYCRKLGLGLGLVKEAPLIGDLGSDYGQVTAFYGYWLGFVTVMDFGWVSKWDANAGESRKARRIMEEENKKVRKKAKKEFNDTVRRLAEFVKKRDKRVIDMNAKKEKEREKKREEEVRKRKEMEREKLERARNYVEPDWARVDEEVSVGIEEEDEDEDEEEEKKEFYCAACGKKFKSDKQWKNHEQSRKHKDKVAELRRLFKEEDVEFEGSDGVGNGDGNDVVDDDVEVNEDDVDEFQGFDGVGNGGLDVEDVEVNDEEKDSGFVSAEDGIEDGDEINEKFKECVGLEEGKNDCVDDAKDVNGVDQPQVGSDEDLSVLEASKSGKRVTFEEQSVEKNDVQSEGEMEAMEYNNKKGKKKSRRAKKDKGKPNDGSNDVGENSNAPGSSNAGSDGDDDEYENRNPQGRGKAGKKGAERKSKRDVESKPKNSSKGRKQKEKEFVPVCEKCGEEFDSRNQLYKHLTETGHASLKSR